MNFTLKNKIFLYLFTVLIPSIFISFLFISIFLENAEKDQEDHLHWVASIHKQQTEQLMVESIKSLEILALSLEEMTEVHHSDGINRILKNANEADPRYSGLFVLNDQGVVVNATNDSLQEEQLLEHDHIQTVLKTKHTIISDHQVLLENGQEVLSIASPILNREDEVLGIIIAHIRVDYLLNLMKMLTPEETISFTNIYDEPILEINMPSDLTEVKNLEWVSVPLTSLPWEIKVQKKELDYSPLTVKFLIAILITFFITNILFLIIQYVLLLKRASFEKAQNEAQKLELVGTLAASTAHEIRNPLTGIKGLVQLLSEKYKTDEDQLYFSVIDQEIKRINEIVSEFLILGKPAVLKTDTIDLQNIIDELKPLIESEAHLYNVVLTISRSDVPLPVLCVKDQLKQVILNITKNAFESMKEGGRLAINAEVKDSKVVLSISDTGIGILASELSKIFQPFYSSKEDGTGLGLVVCKRIVESFNGQIFITSQNHEGTMVTIELPLAKVEG